MSRRRKSLYLPSMFNAIILASLNLNITVVLSNSIVYLSCSYSLWLPYWGIHNFSKSSVSSFDLILIERELLFQMFSPFSSFYRLIIMIHEVTFESSYFCDFALVALSPFSKKSAKSLLQNVLIPSWLLWVIFVICNLSDVTLESFH